MLLLLFTCLLCSLAFCPCFLSLFSLPRPCFLASFHCFFACCPCFLASFPCCLASCLYFLASLPCYLVSCPCFLAFLSLLPRLLSPLTLLTVHLLPSFIVSSHSSLASPLLFGHSFLFTSLLSLLLGLHSLFPASWPCFLVFCHSALTSFPCSFVSCFSSLDPVPLQKSSNSQCHMRQSMYTSLYCSAKSIEGPTT